MRYYIFMLFPVMITAMESSLTQDNIRAANKNIRKEEATNFLRKMGYDLLASMETRMQKEPNSIAFGNIQIHLARCRAEIQNRILSPDCTFQTPPTKEELERRAKYHEELEIQYHAYSFAEAICYMMEKPEILNNCRPLGSNTNQ